MSPGETSMKRWVSILRLSALLLLCGCGGGYNSPPSPGSNPGSNIVSNWQFSTTSTVPGTLPLTIAGSVNQSGGSISGAVHVDGSNCFDRPTTIALTGSLSGNTVSLTSASVAGQVITLTGSLTDHALTDAFSGDNSRAHMPSTVAVPTATRETLPASRYLTSLTS